MFSKFNRALAALCLFVLAVAAQAGTITVTSPAKGTAGAPTIVAASVPIKFNLTGMVGAAKVTATVFRQDNNQIVPRGGETELTPVDGKANGTITVTFIKDLDAEVIYRIEIRATDLQNATTYNTDQDLFVKPDLTKPKFVGHNPIPNSFVKGIVQIRARIVEANFKDYRVQIDGQTLGEGTTLDGTNAFNVNWDTTVLQTDGPRTINIRVRDTADNEEVRNFTVTVDRVAPVITVRAPQNNDVIAPGTTINVTVDIADVSAASLNVTGVDVVIQRTDGSFIARVARLSFQNVSGGTNRWTGRIRWVNGFLPPNFKIVVTAVDRAGNVAQPQTVNLRIGP